MTGRLFAALTALGITLCASAQSPTTDDLSHVQGSVIKLQGATLLVGLQDGGLATYDVGTKQRKMYMEGDGVAPAKDVVMLGTRPWWIAENSQFVRMGVPGFREPVDIDLRDSGLVGPIRRLTVWQEMIVAHAD